MDKHNKNNKCDEILIWGGVEWYRMEIINMVSQIDDQFTLKQIYTVSITLKEMLEEEKGD